tara:strand:- start:193 stop:885 length:693 start_codon:yes stop_codon:yes gene_type:complete
MNNDLIKLINISKFFKKNKLKVLDNINFTFKKGKTYSLIGPSGSGKSTLLNILSLIDRPSKGNIIFGKKKINFDNYETNDNIRASNIGIVYQDKNLLPDFTALENIYLSRLTQTNNLDLAIKDSKKMLRKLNLIKRSENYPSELSGGEAQRIAISRALINFPNFIIADEPTGNLDIKNSKEIFKLLLSLKNKDRVIIYATHNTYFAKMADFKLKISDGKIKSYNERIASK